MRTSINKNRNLHLTYLVWRRVMDRCPERLDIRWHDYDTFLRDIGPTMPGISPTLHSKDRTLPYGPGNTHWRNDHD